MAFLTSLVPIFEDEAIRMVSLDLLALGAREPDITKHFRALASDRSTPLDTMIERGRRRGEVRDDLDPLTLLELIEGPMLETEFTPMRWQSSSTMRISLSGSFALRQAQTNASPFKAGMMSSRV